MRLLELAFARRSPLHCPAGVIAQVWRDGGKQARLARLINSGVLKVHVLDIEEAQAVGALCGQSGGKDIVDASVALLAQREDAVVVTSDPDELRRIDHQLELVVC